MFRENSRPPSLDELIVNRADGDQSQCRQRGREAAPAARAVDPRPGPADVYDDEEAPDDRDRIDRQPEPAHREQAAHRIAWWPGLPARGRRFHGPAVLATPRGG